MAIDFAGLLDRKYANLEANTQGENVLRNAQATSTLGSLDSENALRGAQAFSTTEQGKTLGPLAQSSIAATSAGIGQTQAQTGLTNAQTGLVGAQTQDALFGQSAAAPLSRLNYRNQMRQLNFGLGSSQSGDDPGYGFAAGTPSVPPAPKGGKAAPKAQAKPQAAAGPPMAAPGGPMSLHAVMAHALGALHAAGGATTVPQPAPPPAVPAPGQTITNGTWGSPTPNQDLRAKMGMGVKAAGGATAIQAKAGKTMVPGKGPSNVDSVPATLAPKEAVLNQGAADHLGRGTIAALNALGAAKMAQAGMPPETPPTAHGTMAPARGAPPKAAAAKPIARGAVKSHGKAPPPKVAAKGKGK